MNTLNLAVHVVNYNIPESPQHKQVHTCNKLMKTCEVILYSKDNLRTLSSEHATQVLFCDFCHKNDFNEYTTQCTVTMVTDNVKSTENYIGKKNL